MATATVTNLTAQISLAGKATTTATPASAVKPATSIPATATTAVAKPVTAPAPPVVAAATPASISLAGKLTTQSTTSTAALFSTTPAPATPTVVSVGGATGYSVKSMLPVTDFLPFNSMGDSKVTLHSTSSTPALTTTSSSPFGINVDKTLNSSGGGANTLNFNVEKVLTNPATGGLSSIWGNMFDSLLGNPSKDPIAQYGATLNAQEKAAQEQTSLMIKIGMGIVAALGVGGLVYWAVNK